MGTADELRQYELDLHHVVKADPNSPVRRRAQALLLLAQGHIVAEVARVLTMTAQGVRTGRARWVTEGLDGSVYHARRRRPSKLDETARALLREALDQEPQAYDLPVMVWSRRDLQATLARERQIEVSIYMLHRVVHALGCCYRQPRHDLMYSQDAVTVGGHAGGRGGGGAEVRKR